MGLIWPDSALDCSCRPKVGEAAGDVDAWLWVRGPDAASLESARLGAIHIGMMNPFRAPELLVELAHREVSAISMEMVPRITRARKMDVLSSQANLAGFAGIENSLFFKENTRMLFGDAKASLEALVAEFKSGRS